MESKAEFVAKTNKGTWQAMEIADLKVRAHGDTAVLTGLWTGKGVDGGTGQQVDGREWFVDTWVKMPNGSWQCVLSTGGPVK